MKTILCLTILFGFQIQAKTTILVLGDSLSEGYGLEESMSYPRVLEKKLNDRKKDVTIINGGVSGATSASGIQRLKWHMKKKADVLLLELGANDGLRGLKIDETKKNLTSIIAQAKKENLKVILLGVLMPPNYGKEYVSQFEAMYKEIAREQKIIFYPFILDGVAGNAKLNLPDGMHPNQKGHEVIAEKLAKFLEKNL